MLQFLGFIQLDSTRTHTFTTVNTVQTFKKKIKFKKNLPTLPYCPNLHYAKPTTSSSSFFFGLRLKKPCVSKMPHTIVLTCEFDSPMWDFHVFFFLLDFFNFMFLKKIDKIDHRSKQNRSKLMSFWGGSLPDEHQPLLIIAQRSWFHAPPPTHTPTQSACCIRF